MTTAHGPRGDGRTAAHPGDAATHEGDAAPLGARPGDGGPGEAGSGEGAADPKRAGGRRVLAVDVGTGTADILLTVPGAPLEDAVRLVVPSRTQVVAAQIRGATRRGQTVLFAGPTMGGGADGAAMKAHLAAGHAFVATEEAGRTFVDDLDKLLALGVRVIGEGAAAQLRERLPAGGLTEVRSGDLDPEGLCAALALLGVEPRFDAVAIAVQDHGFDPHGSNRVFRFAFWRTAVQEGRPLGALFYAAADVPPEFTRLKAAAGYAEALADGGPALAADTGPAALYGALPPGASDAVLVNVGNGHTLCAVARHGRLAGVFEHHTRLLDRRRLEEYLRRFLAAELDDDEVRAEGGHGAVLGDPIPDGLPLLVTGPRRALLAGSELPLEFAAPHGDMMLTGCYGLLRAFAERGVRHDAPEGPASAAAATEAHAPAEGAP